jgi:hypothetical protein
MVYLNENKIALLQKAREGKGASHVQGIKS